MSQRKPKAISFKIAAQEEFHKIVLQSATDLMIRTANIDSRVGNKVNDLRGHIISAYDVLAHAINQHSGRPYTFVGTDLYGLTVDMHPALGTYTVRVSCKIDEVPNRDQDFIIHVVPRDGHTTFTRNVTTPIVEVGKDVNDIALRNLRSL